MEAREMIWMEIRTEEAKAVFKTQGRREKKTHIATR